MRTPTRVFGSRRPNTGARWKPRSGRSCKPQYGRRLPTTDWAVALTLGSSGWTNSNYLPATRHLAQRVSTRDLLDINVLSEFTRHSPEADVLARLDSFPATEVATTAITAAELLYGVSRLPAGHRKSSLATAVHALINEDFHGRVESFDAPAAAHYAVVVGERDRLGRPISAADAQIAAICRAREATLATRNVKDFEETGIELINPWQARCGKARYLGELDEAAAPDTTQFSAGKRPKR